MSNAKTETIGKYFPAIWIVSMALLSGAAYGKVASKDPSSELTTSPKQFVDLKVQPEIYSERHSLLRLKITWNPTMTKDKRFRVTVLPIEGGKCRHEFCDEDGSLTNNATLFIPSEPTDPDTSDSQCRIDPGCNYTIIVQNKKENYESKITYTVPNRVGNVRSCQHELPVVIVVPTIDSQIMTIRWQIQGNYSVHNDTSVYIVTKVYENKEKMVKVFNHTLTNPEPKQLSGEFVWNVTKSNAIYFTRTFVSDSHNCAGFAPFVEPARRNPHHDNQPTRVKWLIIAAVAFVAILPVSLFLYKKTMMRPNGSGMAFPPDYWPPSIEPLPPWRPDVPSHIDPSNLQLIKIIGEGAFGNVYIARLTIHGERTVCQTVAVKQLKRIPTEQQKDEFEVEIEMMKTVSRHPNIVALIGFCIDREPLQIIMEYVGCGDLRAYLLKLRARHEERYGQNRITIPSEPSHNRPLLAPPSGRYLDLMNSSTTSTSDSSHATETEGTNLRPSVTTEYTTLSNNDDIASLANSLDYVLDHRELHNFARQIAEGMKHLHDMKITHRDLAARNILIDEHKTLKISDFGLSRSGIYVPIEPKAVPLRWLSIEAIRNNLYSPESDVWAFGIVLWEIGALGGHPYHSLSNYDLLPYLLAGNRLEKPENCSDYLYDLMRDCWATKPADRPNFSQILSRLDLHERTYVDFSEISSDYVFPPTKEQMKYKKISNGHLRH